MTEGKQENRTSSIYGTEFAAFSLDFSGKGLAEAPADDSLDQIRVINCSSNQLSTLEFLKKSANLIQIDASQNKIKDGLEALANQMFLTSLNLSSNLFESLKGFPQSETLTKLDMSKNFLTTACDLPPLPFLTDLDLSHNSIVDLKLPQFQSLQVLNISGNKIERLSLPALPSLRTLDASSNSIAQIDEFEKETLPCLWQCDISKNALSDPKCFSSLSHLPLLFSLKVIGNPLYKESGEHKAPILVILPELTELDGQEVNAKDKVKATLSVNGPNPSA